MINDNRKIGIGLTGFGVFFLFLGVLLLFDHALLALGNVLFLSGITLLIGTRKTFIFFFKRGQYRGTICFLGGIILVMVGWAITGMFFELFGIINLFGNFFPVVLLFLRRMPIIGNILNLPVIAPLIDRVAGSILPSSMSREE